mmetsp:Transcript_107541/g.286158  ORF Transcript_107541/g.286158 Transcript_107541/m.286158 type:complete len:333 (-) Transcript_107541:263-1261(-)
MEPNGSALVAHLAPLLSGHSLFPVDVDARFPDLRSGRGGLIPPPPPCAPPPPPTSLILSPPGGFSRQRPDARAVPLEAATGELDCSTRDTAVSAALAVIDEQRAVRLLDGLGGAGPSLAAVRAEQRGTSSPITARAITSAFFPDGKDDKDVEYDEAQGEPPANPGSIGHPELCPRPCLYFPSGRCVNGEDCNFCHFPHPKRPAHLDKRHRAMLKEMRFADCVALVLPILKEKAQCLNFGPEVRQRLDALAVHSDGDAGYLAHQKPSRETSALRTALRAMSLRSLLTTLHRAALPASSPDRAAIDDLLERLRLQSCGRDIELQSVASSTNVYF